LPVESRLISKELSAVKRMATAMRLSLIRFITVVFKVKNDSGPQ
jgi:hypothetical protein